jgi:hypothetical protein
MSDEMTGPYVGPTPPPSGTRFAPRELLFGRYTQASAVSPIQSSRGRNH